LNFNIHTRVLVTIFLTIIIYSCAGTSHWNEEIPHEEKGLLIIGLLSEIPEITDSKVEIAVRWLDQPRTYYWEPNELKFWLEGKKRPSFLDGNGYFVAEPGKYAINHIIIRDVYDSTRVCYSAVDIYNKFNGPHPDSGYVVLPHCATYVGSIREYENQNSEINYELVDDYSGVKKWIDTTEHLSSFHLVDQSKSNERNDYFLNYYATQIIDNTSSGDDFPEDTQILMLGFPYQTNDSFFPFRCELKIKKMTYEGQPTGYSRDLLIDYGQYGYEAFSSPGVYELDEVTLYEGYNDTRGQKMKRLENIESQPFILKPNTITYIGNISVSPSGWEIVNNPSLPEKADEYISSASQLSHLEYSDQTVPWIRERELDLYRETQLKNIALAEAERERKQNSGNSSNFGKLIGIAAGAALLGTTDLSSADKLQVGIDVASTIITGESTLEIPNSNDPAVGGSSGNQSSSANISGRWTQSVCGKMSVMNLNNDGTGNITVPECTGQCDDSEFVVKWSATANQITLTYVKATVCSKPQQTTIGKSYTSAYQISGSSLTIGGKVWNR